MNRALRRGAPIALAAAAALVLAGCAGGGDEPAATETPSADGCLTIPTGAASDGVQVSGEVGSEPTVEFDSPVEVEASQRTVAESGDGDTTASGDQVNAQISLYNGTSGDAIFTDVGVLTVGDAQLLPAFLAGIDCVPVGSRVVTVVPPAELYGESGNEQLGLSGEDSVVIVTDVLEIVQPPEAGEWTENVPEVTDGADGIPSVKIPDAEANPELQIAVLEEGDGAEVQAGDDVTLDYQGTSWDTGEVFDQSYGKDQVTFSTGGGLIPGFTAALVGQKVGTKLLVTIPPEFAYGEEGTSGHELEGQTLVFLIEIHDAKAPGAE